VTRRLKVLGSRSTGRCAYCASPVYPAGSAEALNNPNAMATRDHVVPQFFATSCNDRIYAPTNKVVACRLCNSVKGGYPADIFRFYLAETRGTPRFNATEFKRFIFGLALAGYHAARRDALSRKPKSLPPRGPQGRFTKRDLRRAA